MTSLKIITTCISLFFFYTPLVADYTYLNYDTLVFGNGGGLELVTSDNETYFLQVLNLSGSDSTYISKGFATDGKLMSVLPTTGNAYSQNDTMEMQNIATFESGVAPLVNDQLFPTDRNLFVGEYYGNFMLINDDTIAGYEMVEYDNYVKAPIYLQDEYGYLYMGNTGRNIPVLSVFPSIDSKAYVGINTLDPIKMLTVSGDFRVDGALILEKSLGVVESDMVMDVASPYVFDLTNETVMLNSLIFTFPGPVSANVMIIGVTNSLDNNYGPHMQAYFNLLYKDENGDWVAYDNPNETPSVPAQSKRVDDGGPNLGTFPMTPFISIELTPNDDGSDRQYAVQYIAEVVGSESGDTYKASACKILVLGLPSGSFSSIETSLPEVSAELTQIAETSFTELDGNYLTDQLLSFGSGGGIMEFGTNLVFTTGENYMNFRASSLSFGEYHSIDTLKISNELNGYHFQVGDDSGNNLGFTATKSFYGGIVTHNIQTLQLGTSVRDTTLTFESDVYVSDAFSVLTSGSVSPNVQIGNVDEDSSVMLNVQDDILFTGSFTGTGILMDYTYINPNNYSGNHFSGGGFALNPNDYIVMTLPDTSEWDVSIFLLATTHFKDRVFHNQLFIYYSDGADPSINQHSLGEVQIYVDDDKINSGHILNFHKVHLTGGTYSFYMQLVNDNFTNAGGDPRWIDYNNDGVFDALVTMPREGGALCVIATPSN